MSRPETYVPRVHLADPGQASALARTVRDAVAGTLVARPERRAGFERLRGRVAVRVRPGRDAADGLVGLLFDRGTLVVWDGAPPGGAQVELTVPRGEALWASRRAPTLAPVAVGLTLRAPGGRRHPRLALGASRILGLR